MSKLPVVNLKEVIESGTGVRFCILEINGKEYGAHVFGLEPIAHDAGRVTTDRNGKQRVKSTNTVAKYARAMLSFSRNGKVIQTGFWAGQPAQAVAKAPELTDDFNF